jgi:hypothetical protein
MQFTSDSERGFLAPVVLHERLALDAPAHLLPLPEQVRIEGVIAGVRRVRDDPWDEAPQEAAADLLDP